VAGVFGPVSPAKIFRDFSKKALPSFARLVGFAPFHLFPTARFHFSRHANH
jgi:hypothetical protein